MLKYLIVKALGERSNKKPRSDFAKIQFKIALIMHIQIRSVYASPLHECNFAVLRQVSKTAPAAIMRGGGGFRTGIVHTVI